MRFRQLVVWGLRSIGWAAAALALIGFAGTISRAADLASHFRVLYAFAIFPALATYSPKPRRTVVLAAVLALVLVVDCTTIAVLYLPVSVRGAPQHSIRLLQFNTWLKHSNDQDVLALIESPPFDIVSLQETSASLREVVAGRLVERYRILTAGTELLLVRRGGPSIQLQNWVRHAIPGGEAIEARLDLAAREVTVLSFHAMAPLGLARAAIRDAQFEWVARWSRARPGRVIVLGDLNATPWSYPFTRMLREGGLIDSSRGFGVQSTWRVRIGPLGGWAAWPMQIPIDHCLHSPGLIAVKRATGPACGSNHFPLLVTLKSTRATTP